MDHFYEIKSIERKEEEGIVEVELNPEHAVYVGHFPGKPVLPGVCTLMIVKECMEQLTGKKLYYYHLHRCKFLAPVLPDQDKSLRLVLAWQELPEEEFRMRALVSHSGTPVLDLRCNLSVRTEEGEWRGRKIDCQR